MSRVEWIKNPDDFPPRGSPVGGGSAGGQLGNATVKGQMMLGQDMLFYGGYLPCGGESRVAWGRASDAERTPISYNPAVGTRLTWLAGMVGDPAACAAMQDSLKDLKASRADLLKTKADLQKQMAAAAAAGNEEALKQLAATNGEIDGYIKKVDANIANLNSQISTCEELKPPPGPAPTASTSKSSGGGWGLLLLAGSAALAIFKGLS